LDVNRLEARSRSKTDSGERPVWREAAFRRNYRFRQGQSGKFCDPPYNLRVAAIGGRGKVRHGEFAFASGEMTQAEFRAFLSKTPRIPERCSPLRLHGLAPF
jgi:hypothetical protein